jgi:hypothetical protein
MTELTNAYFEQFGFVVFTAERTTDLMYGVAHEREVEEDLALPRSSVLFSIIDQADDRVRMSVTPALLDVSVETPFLIDLTAPEEIRQLFDATCAKAQALDLPQGRIAEYLALRQLNRRLGEHADYRLLAYLARIDMNYTEKLAIVMRA